MAPSRCLNSPRKRQSKRPNSRLPYKRDSPSSNNLLVPSTHSMLTRTRARYNRELESPLVPPLALLPLTLPLTAQSDERVVPSHNSVKPSEHLILTRSQVGLESSLVPPVALLPPIASLTARILGVIDHHHGEMGSFADTFKGIVLESHMDLDWYIRQEIGTRDSQIEEERGRAEKNTELAKEQDVRMHELKLHFEEKENALRQQLENCQTHLGVLRHRIQKSRARILQKPAPSLTIRQGVECIADAQGVIAPPSYHLQWPVRTSWSCLRSGIAINLDMCGKYSRTTPILFRGTSK
ncbi:hypothetical protein F5876DRAFT_70696 [Lentinula aff. lateritia]|uniref:Uncharacterized protein n=1 Tax=Lentinula aff. lateritia TaxID=2804960 RepID=A0ACC1TI63_9AGAR|nr:hypothetical protein F5876DRAFT_70696 [Lentinula aff. lateritia]